jgi:hypothetical protein
MTDSVPRAVHTATDEVVHDGAVGTPTWAACEREFGADPAVLIELVTAIGAVANDRLDPAQPGGAVGGRRLQLAAGWSATESISLREFLARRETTPGSALLFPSLCRPTAEIAASGRLTDDRCRERTAMMPTRHHSRAQNRAHRVAAERRQNREAREARSNQWVSAYFGPAPPSGEDDEPPPF